MACPHRVHRTFLGEAVDSKLGIVGSGISNYLAHLLVSVASIAATLREIELLQNHKGS